MNCSWDPVFSKRWQNLDTSAMFSTSGQARQLSFNMAQTKADLHLVNVKVSSGSPSILSLQAVMKTLFLRIQKMTLQVVEHQYKSVVF
jgi:hypothetical protein